MTNHSESSRTPWTLINRLKDLGDAASWKDFEGRYGPLVMSIALKAGLRREEAQDVAQEALASVARNIGDFVALPEHGSFRAWFLNLVRWRIADQFRRRLPISEDQQTSAGTYHTPAVERVADESLPSLEAVCDAKWAEWLQEQALAELRLEIKAERYQIFHLLTIKGKSVPDVARLVGLSPARIYVIKHRVNSALRRILKRLKKELE